jgi:hypothetical protein
MKLSSWKERTARRSFWFSSRGLTLPETMITLILFALVLGGLVASQLYGLRMFQVTSPKLQAGDEARLAMSELIDDVRSAKLIRIGTGNLGSFTETAADQPQRGNAIQVYPTLTTNAYLRYFLDGNDQRLKRTTNGSTATLVLANSITNTLIFTSEDYAGNVLTNNHNNRVIGLKMEFYQIQYPRMTVGPGNYYDYYQLHTRITRRTLM